jgi:putative membrane protein
MKARGAGARASLRALLSPLALGLDVAACGGSAANIAPRPPSTPTPTTAAPASIAVPTTSSEPAERAPDRAPSPGPIDLEINASGGAVPMVPPAPIPPMSEARDSDATFTDPEIVAVVDAANLAEKRIAREAFRRALNPRVRALARRAVMDRVSASLERIERVGAIAPRESAASAAIAASGVRVAASIESARVRDFDRICVEALAGEESRIVRLLDDVLIPQSRDGELRTLLEDVRTRVSARLQTAEDLYPTGLRDPR